MYNNNEENNNNGNQKGSLLDWLLTFFLIRKSQQKKYKEVTKSPKKDKDDAPKKINLTNKDKNNNPRINIKPTGLSKEEVKKTIKSDPVTVKNKKTNIEQPQEEMSPNHIIEKIIAIDNILKQEHHDDDKIKDIIDKISKTIKKQLTKCHDELDEIDEKLSEVEKEKEITKLKKQLQDICNQLVLLQYRVESLKKGRFYNYSYEENQKIIAMVKDLNSLSTKENIEAIISACEAKLVTTMEFLNAASKQSYVSDNVNAKGSSIAVRNEYFEKNKGKLTVVKDIESITKMTILEQEKQIKRIKKEMQELEPKIMQITHMKGFGKLFGNTLKLIWGIFSLPLSSTKSKLFGSILIGNSIKGLKKAITFEKEEITYYEYSKFNYAISSTVNRLNDIDYILRNALTDIKELKITYNYHFREYQYAIPEYAEFYTKIEELENKIINEREKVQNSIEVVKSQRQEDKVLKKIIAG